MLKTITIENCTMGPFGGEVIEIIFFERELPSPLLSLSYLRLCLIELEIKLKVKRKLKFST